MDILYQSRKYEIISTDITNYCNSRCKFCFNPFGEQPVNMPKEVFTKVLQTLPLSKHDGFYFSCLYEPTVNPDFIDFLQLLPVQFRDNTFFIPNNNRIVR